MRFGSWIASGSFHFDIAPTATPLRAGISHFSLTEEKIAELTWRYLSAESFETTRVSLATKAAVARLIGTDGTQEVNLAQCRPQHIRKVELAVHALPKKKT